MIILGGLFAAGADLLAAPDRGDDAAPFVRRTGRAGVAASHDFGRKVGVIGAAALALDAFFYRQGTNP